MASKATIEVVPQHIPSDAPQVHWRVNYSGVPKPNDIHVAFRPVSAFRKRWRKVFDKDIVAALPFKGHFDKPEPGAYDIRVRFTLDGTYLADGERIGQFFVDL